MDDLDRILDTVESVEINDIVGAVLSDSQFDIKREIGSQLPYTRRVMVNDLVPEEYQQKLMEIDYTMSKCYWLIGDITTELINSVNRVRARELGKAISKTDIFEAVGFFCHRSARSVRYYYEVAHYFPLEVRQKYDVQFNIYAEARWLDNWELVLKLSAENPMWSAERVRSEYYNAMGETKPVREKSEHIVDTGAETESDELPLPVRGEQWSGQSQSRFKDVLLSKLDHTVDDLRAVLDRVPLPTDIRVKIGDVLLEIQNISLEIRREV